MPVGKFETIKEIEKMLAGVRESRKPKVKPEVLPPVEVEEPEELTGIRQRLAKGYKVVLTSELARGMGLDIDFPEDWMLKVAPGKNGEEPAFTFRSPEGLELLPEDILETPEGEWITRQQVREVERVEEVSEEGRVAEVGELTSLFQTVFPEMLAPFTEEQLPEVTQELVRQLIESPEMQELFFETVQTQGRTPETERLLKMLLPEVTDEQLTEFFAVEEAKPEGEAKSRAVLQEVFWASDISSEDWDALYDTKGNREKVEAWAKKHIAEGITKVWIDKIVQQITGVVPPMGLSEKAQLSFVAGIGDVLNTSGGTARWLGYEDIGAELSEVGESLQRHVPPSELGEFEVVDLLNPEFYATKIVRALPFALSLAPMAIGGYYGGAALAAAVGISKIGLYIIGGLAGAAMSRPVESALEAGGAYDDAIARGKTEKEAREEANEVFRNNMVLAGADAWEIAIALAPTPKWVPTALVKSGLVRTARVAGKMVIVGLSEGGEEVYQDMITRRARGEDWQLDPVAKEVFAIGMVMGMGMGLGGDVISSIVNRSKEKMSPELKKDFDGAVSDFKEAGFTDEQAELRGLDTIAEIAEGEEIIKDAIKAEERAVVTPPKVVPPTVPEVVPEVVPKVVPPVGKIDRVELSYKSIEEINAIREAIEDNPKNLMPEGSFHKYIPKARKQLDDIAWAITNKLAREAKPPAVEEVARPEPEMPEAGIQPTMIPEVPTKEVRPKAKAKIVQISMEDQLKLEQARRVAEEALPEEKAAYEAQAEIEGMKAWLETEPATKLVDLIKKTGWYKGEVSNLTLKQYRDITGKRDIKSNILTPDKKHVRWEYALDDIATEMGYESSDVLKAEIERTGEARARIKALESEVKAHFMEKPLVALPEPTPEETKAITPTGEQMLTPAQQARTLDLFGKYVMSESVVDAWGLTRDLRRDTRAGRAEQLKARAQELIVSEGITTEEAMNQATRETMAGELPAATTDYLSDLTSQMRETLFNKVYETLKAEPFEMMSTAEALTNALLGRAIPRELGVKGGSAFTRLQRVFGDQPQVMKALDTVAKKGKSLEDVVEGIFHEIGRAPIPLDQQTADYLRGLKSDIVYTPTAFREPTPVTRYEAPIKDAIKQVPMWPTPVRDNIIRVLKEIGWFPVDIGNFIRANKASFDMSFWRQQGPLIINHPVSFVQSNIEAWKALFSQKAAEASWERISRDPLYELYAIAEEAGHDFLRPLELKKGTSQWRGVEEFGYLTGERIVPKLTGMIPHVKLSARAFVTGTNEHNWRIFKNHYNAMLRLNEKYASGELKLKVGESFSIEKEMIDMAKMLTDFTQRASLGRVSGIIPALNALIFAPRATLGRLLTPRHLVSANPRIRMEAWRDLTTFVSGIGSIVLLGNLLGLWEVEKDPRNAEYMSIRVGNLRLDPWSGYRQFLVFYTRVITGTGLSSVTGAEYNINPLMAMTSFARGKAAPLASFFLDWWVGKTFIGEEFDVANKRQWAERMSPFALWDIYETYMDDPAMALPVTIPAIVGMGVQTYTGDWIENWTKMGLSKYSDNLVYGLTEPTYDAKDFWSDTSSQFAGVDPATLTKEKGFPPYIRAIAETRIINEHLRTLPNEKLVSLNADPTKDEGKTFAVYYQQWRDREKLVREGDEEKLKEFDQDERTRNAERGNFSQRQFALLNEYWAITDKVEQVEFLEEHKEEIGVNLRQEWLRSHTKENAQLAVWGQAKILTLEAYKEFKRLLKELDIPDNAIPEFTLPPETSMETHFTYEEMVDEGTHSSVEARLLLLKDHLAAEEAEVQSYANWHDLKVSDEQVEYLQLRVDNHELYGKLDEIRADEKLSDAAKEEAIAKVRETKVGDETFRDIERRVEVMGKGSREVPIDPEVVDAFVKHMQIVDETSGSSAEAKLNRYDNPDLDAYLMNEDLHGEQKAEPLDEDKNYLDNYLVPRWRIDVKYRTEDAEYDAIPGDDRVARDAYLEEHEGYRKDRRRRDAYIAEGVEGERFTGDQVESFVEYWELDIKGMMQERYLLEHPDFANAMHNIKGIDLPKPQDVPLVQFDEIYEKWQPDFERMEGLSDHDSEHYIEDTEERDLARETMRFDVKGKLTDFGMAEIRKKGYGFFVPEKYIDRFVEFDSLRAEKRQVDYPDGMTWYGDEWYLFDHPLFYKDIYIGLFQLDEVGWVPHSKWRGLWEDWKELDFEYEGVSDRKSEFYIENEDKRKEVRERLLTTTPEYRQDRRKRGALLLKLPDDYLDDYVGYYEIPFTDKAKSLDPFYKEHPNESYYEDDWYLKEHLEFYEAMLALRDKDGFPIWEPRKGFNKVPTREVHALYKEYRDEIKGKPRDDFRWENRDLDAWLLLTDKVSISITEKRRRAALTPSERMREEVKEIEERLKR